jgi:cell division transport system permease protein
MSTTDAIQPGGAGRGRNARAVVAALEPPAETPIVPRATIAGRALVAVIAIMTFLAALTLGAVIMVRAAAKEWQAEVGREVTIQVRPTAGRDIESDLARAAAIARNSPGVLEARAYSKEETAQLLEPWLGSGLRVDDLPMPRLIVVRLAAGAPDLAPLRRRLEAEIAQATLDDHRGFVERMRAVSAAVLAAGMAVLVLVLAATLLSVSFATRAAMATNRPVIEVLNLIGAKDDFIAGHFQRHFLRLGLQGGLIGGGSAMAVLALAQLAGGWLGGSTGGDQLALLLGSYSIGVLGYGAVLALVVVVALLTAATSRYTVARTIATAR